MSLSKDETEAIMRAVEYSISYRQTISNRKIPPEIDATEATRRLGGKLNEVGEEAANVIDNIISEGEAGLLQIISSRFF